MRCFLGEAPFVILNDLEDVKNVKKWKKGGIFKRNVIHYFMDNTLLSNSTIEFKDIFQNR